MINDAIVYRLPDPILTMCPPKDELNAARSPTVTFLYLNCQKSKRGPLEASPFDCTSRGGGSDSWDKTNRPGSEKVKMQVTRQKEDEHR